MPSACGGQPGRLPLGLLAAALVLSSTLATAEGARIEGILEFTRALHQGLVDARLPVAAAYGNGSAAHGLRFEGVGHAARIVVNWTSYDRAGAGVPDSNPGASLVSFSLGPAETGERLYEDVDWSVLATRPTGNWLLDAPPGSVTAGLFQLDGAAWIEPSPGVTWLGGSRAQATTPTRDWERLSAGRDVPRGVPMMSTSSAVQWAADGSFTLYVWETNVTVGGDTYRSGQWATTSFGDAAGPRGVARIERTQLLRIRVEGWLRATSEGERAGWAGDGMDLTTLGRVALEHSTGSVDVEGLLERCDDASVTLEGRFAASIARTSGGHVLRTNLRSDDRPPALVAPETPPSVPDLAVRPEAADGTLRQWFAVAAFAGFALVSGVATAVRVADRHALLGAERALLHGRPDRASRVLRSRLRRRPYDVHAWFLHGVALLREEGPAALVRILEPVARRLPAPERLPLSFLLALSFARLGVREAALEWAGDAARDPAYRIRFQKDTSFAALRDDAAFARVVQ